MRVLVFSTQHLATGGIESHLKEFCLHLTRSGVEVDLLITNATLRPETEAFYRQTCRRVFLGKAKRASWRLGWLMAVLPLLRAAKYDALYTNGQGESIRLLATVLAGTTWWVHHHHTAGDAADQAHWGNHYWKALRTADRVIACSQRNARLMEAALHRPIDTVPCFSRAVPPASPAPPGPRRIRLGYYGRLIPEKGIDLMCRLSDDPELSSTEFHIWGEGSAYPSAFFNRYPNLHYHGAFDGLAKLTEVLHSLDGLLLLTTNAEGLPISLLESMSAGLPWLSTDRGGITDIALDPDTTRVIAANASYEQVRKAVYALSADLRLGRLSGQQQVALYTRKFSANVLVRQWRAVLKLDHSLDTQLTLLAR